ncbi:MAG: hypothetical protein ACOH15_04935 [Acetobacterium sp.]
MNFKDFVSSFSTCSVVANSVSAKHIYNHIIWTDSNRIKMVEFIEAGISPLTVIVEEIETYCQNSPSNDLDLTNHQVKQTIGRMVATSLAPLGFTVFKKGRVTNKNAIYFKNASHYTFTGDETQRVVKYIELL